jgi:hypothetical protein
MKTKKIVGVVILLVMLLTLGFVNHALAEEETEPTQHKFTVVNKSLEDVAITLKRKMEREQQTFTLPAGDTDSIMIEEGTYVVKYSFCRTDYHWDLELDDDYTLTLYPCGAQPTKMQVKSHLNEEVELKIYGYEDLELDVKPGVKVKVELFSGNIDYEYEACGGQTFFGELNVAKNGTTQLVMHSCEWHLEPARNYAQPNPVKFRIINHASFPIIMTLIGPESYLVTVDPGINVFTMISGNYRYSYYQDSRLLTGSMVVTPNGLGTLVVTPSFVMDFVDEAADLE